MAIDRLTQKRKAFPFTDAQAHSRLTDPFLEFHPLSPNSPPPRLIAYMLRRGDSAPLLVKRMQNTVTDNVAKPSPAGVWHPASPVNRDIQIL